MSEPINCTNAELSTFLAALGEGYLPTCSWDTRPSVPSREISIASKTWCVGRRTGRCRGFRFSMMYVALMGDLGAVLSMSWRAAFRAKICRSKAKEKGFMESAVDCGERWRGLLVKFCQDTRSWKTHRCLWTEDLSAYSLSLPAWGMMLDGELWERMPWALPTIAKDSGLSLRERGRQMIPTLTASDSKRVTLGIHYGQKSQRKGTADDFAKWAARYCYQKFGWERIRLLPAMGEWMMGWPSGWTNFEPLEMDKFQQWLRAHGRF